MPTELSFTIEQVAFQVVLSGLVIATHTIHAYYIRTHTENEREREKERKRENARERARESEGGHSPVSEIATHKMHNTDTRTDRKKERER